MAGSLRCSSMPLLVLLLLCFLIRRCVSVSVSVSASVSVSVHTRVPVRMRMGVLIGAQALDTHTVEEKGRFAEWECVSAGTSWLAFGWPLAFPLGWPFALRLAFPLGRGTW